MSTQQPADLKIESIPNEDTQRWLVFGLANLAAVCVLSLVSWYLLVDPDVMPYPQPYSAYLFWGILVVVWLGFCLEVQPIRSSGSTPAGHRDLRRHRSDRIRDYHPPGIRVGGYRQRILG